MKKITLCLTTALLLGGCGTKDVQVDPQIETPKFDTPQFDKPAMDNLFTDAVATGEVIGVSALVFDEGKVVYKGAFGQADRERNIPVDFDTVFRIYSMTKPITSALIMDLQEEGLLSVDDPVSKYIPELANMQVATAGADGALSLADQVQPMTIKDLLLHRSGLGYGIFGAVSPVEEQYIAAKLSDRTIALPEKMQTLSKLPLLAQPGDGYFYSYSIDVLGRIAEIVGKDRLGDLMQARFFKPLGMTETSFRVRPDQKARFATTYFIQDDGSYVVAEDSQTSPFLEEDVYQSGGGGLVSTLGDYAKFTHMMLNGGELNGIRILETSTVKTMMQDHLDADDKAFLPWVKGETGLGHGYGGTVVTAPTDMLRETMGYHMGQWGWGGAARTQFYVDPENDAFAIIMLQFFGGEDPSIRYRFRSLAYAQTRDAETTYSD